MRHARVPGVAVRPLVGGPVPLGGSFVTADIEDHYVTPNDLGLGRVVKFDHDFIGRDALEEIAQRPPRTKVALIRAHEDVMRILSSGRSR
jgi:vanillate/3-O-methylgallate O-demethylase